MRKFNILVLLSVLCVFASCTKDNLDDLTGKFDVTRYEFKTASVGSLLQKGDYYEMRITFSDGQNNLVVDFGSSDSYLTTGTYVLADEVTMANTYTATFNGGQVTNGVELVMGESLLATIDITLVGDRYFMETYMYANGEKFVAKYKGPIQFPE